MAWFFCRFLMFRYFGLSRFVTRLFRFLDLWRKTGKDLPGYLEVLFHDCREIDKDLVLCRNQDLKFGRQSRQGIRRIRSDLSFLQKLAAAFPDLADAVDPFLFIREGLAVSPIKIMAVLTLDNEIDLCIVDLLIFSFMDTGHARERLDFF